MTSNFDAAQLTDLQACPRKLVLNQEWRQFRWRPKSLFDACLRKAVLEFSNRTVLEKVHGDARAMFLQAAANPGLDVAGMVYGIAKEWCALLEVLICSFPYMNIPRSLKEGPVVSLNSAVRWQITAQVDAHGDLHRFVTVDHWDRLAQDREVHSWWVAGDIAAAGRRMYLHVIEIGQMRNGRRASVWVRGWRHPGIPGLRIRFRKVDGDSSFRGWTPVRLAEHPQITLADWVDMVWKDQAGTPLLHTIEVAAPEETRRGEILHEVLLESIRARNLLAEQTQASLKELPMSRGSCDFPSPCPYRAVCYDRADLEKSGLYIRRQGLVELTKSA